ncbi:DUF4232 domain-containing protein [Streptomyces sp. NPDC005498]|uniref:DUF4232 domain-containing protein n=1 Tax=Streptomyces sp. NPDC005498 TaxID=3364717 RepID=UPI0036A65A3B
MVHGRRRWSQTIQVVTGAALAATLAACGSSSSSSSPPDSPTAAASSGDAVSPAASSSIKAAAPPASASASASAGAVAGTTAPAGRCHTSDLRASLGGDSPGAGQENFPVVLTNTSGDTCSVTGYPGAAFTDAAGGQLGPDPARTPGTPATVTLAPGRSAWAGLSFTHPRVSGATSATPAYLVITPPDEEDALRVAWGGGAIPVSGPASATALTVLSPGTGR